MPQRIKTTVTVTLEVDTGSVWTSDTTMQQIIDQSRDDADGRIRKLFCDASNDDTTLSSKREATRGIRLVHIGKVATRAEDDR